MSEYIVLISPLPSSEGGYLAAVPDLPGCMSDGATAEMAYANVAEAVAAWVEEACRLGRPVPPPTAVARVIAVHL